MCSWGGCTSLSSPVEQKEGSLYLSKQPLCAHSTDELKPGQMEVNTYSCLLFQHSTALSVTNVPLNENNFWILIPCCFPIKHFTEHIRSCSYSPVGFRIFAIGRCYNEMCCSWPSKWAFQTRADLKRTWKLPVADMENDIRACNVYMGKSPTLTTL